MGEVGKPKVFLRTCFLYLILSLFLQDQSISVLHASKSGPFVFVMLSTDPYCHENTWQGNRGLFATAPFVRGAVCTWGLNAAKRNIYSAGIKHCILVLLIRRFTHRTITQNRSRKNSRREKRKRFGLSLSCNVFLQFSYQCCRYSFVVSDVSHL